MRVIGVEIFPNEDPEGAVFHLVDLLYACALGRPSAELPEDNGLPLYTAVYTEVLLDALSGGQRSLLQSLEDDG
jgi:hypothetical protein